mgnify:CR=1 FL=1
MPWEAWITGTIILAMVAALMAGRWSADAVIVGAGLLLMLVGQATDAHILTPAEFAGGFASPAVITVAMLYVVAVGMKETGAMAAIAARLIGSPRSAIAAQARLILPVTGLSAFINNTPIVAMFLPVLDTIARRTGVPAARLFMPLSFASVLGGVCTLIGTSTNVVVAGLLAKAAIPDPDREGQTLAFGMFTIAAVGLPVALAGVAYMLAFGRLLLPVRERPTEQARRAQARQYLCAVRVEANSPLVGRTVEQGGLRHLRGLYLSRIDREPEPVLAVDPEETVILPGDILVFVGDLDSVVELQQFRGLSPVSDETGGACDAKYRPSMRLIEAVVSGRSALVGQTIRESQIRTRYGAVVLAVHRQGHRLAGKIGDIRLRPGDTLLLEAPPGFVRRHRESTDFHLAYEREEPAAPRHDRAWIAVLIMAALVVLISVDWVDPMVGAMCAAAAMVATRCCTGAQARAGVQWNILIAIGAAFGLGQAMENTGLAVAVAGFFTDLAAPAGPHVLLAVIYLLTLVFTMAMSNNAAAVLMFPIAVALAQASGLSPMPFAIAITVAASCEFSSPIGYQTHLMVMGPGGYKWLDFTRFGLPLTLLAAGITIGITPVVFPF